MKGIILAGGAGTRLYPVTLLLNKNLLPVYNKPAIFYSVEMLRDGGIRDIVVVAEHNHIEDFKYMLGNGADFGVNLVYENDTPIKKGPASAIGYAKDFVAGDNAIVVFADGIYDLDISFDVANFEDGCIVFAKEVEDPNRFGIVEIGENNKVLSIEEKPEFPKSNLAFTGLAIYDHSLFDYISRVKPGLNGEYYTTDVHKIYMEEGKLSARIIDGFWQDMGTFDGLYNASRYWYEKTRNKV